MFLLINSLIFNGFSIWKKFWKAETHQIWCILKHVEDVKDKLSTPMGCNAMYVKDVEDSKNCLYTQDLMLSLKSPMSQLSKTSNYIVYHNSNYSN